MDDNRLEGPERGRGGKGRGAVGSLTSESALQKRGKINQEVRTNHLCYAQVMDEVLLFAADVGLALGVLRTSLLDLFLSKFRGCV